MSKERGVYLRPTKDGRTMFWIVYHYRGQRFRESSHSGNPNVAMKLRRKRLAELERGIDGRAAERMHFDDLTKLLMSDYNARARKSAERAERSMAHVRRVFGNCRVTQITAVTIRRYVDERLKSAKPATVKLECAALKRALNLAVKEGSLSYRPAFPTIEVRNTRAGFFEPDQLQAVLDQLNPDLRPVVQFAAITGWRKSEILGLEWRQVDFAAGSVRLEPGTTKNDDGRTFLFGGLPALAELLKSQQHRTSAIERAEGKVIRFVFHRRGKPIRSFHQAWQGACRRAGVPGRLVHDLRRTAVRAFERAGVPRGVAMKLSGHRTESIYRRYAIVSETDLAEGIARLARADTATQSATRAKVAAAASAGDLAK